MLIAAGVAGLLYAMVFVSRKTAAPPTSAPAAHAPSAAKPPAALVARYSVPPEHPKYLSVPRLKIAEARIKPLGTLDTGQMASPDNIYDAGWYKASAKPGEQGAMFIYGHVSSWEANGLFYEFKKLRKDDIVTITNGADRQFPYRVVATKTYPRGAVDMLLGVANATPSNWLCCVSGWDGGSLYASSAAPGPLN